MDEQKLKEIRERIETAFLKMDEQTMVINAGQSQLEVVIQMNRYHFKRRTHLSAPYLDALESGVLALARGEADDKAIKSILADLKDASELCYYDQRYLIFEPSESDFERFEARFNATRGERTVPLEDTIHQQMTRLLEKMHFVYTMRKADFEKELVPWDVLKRAIIQFKQNAERLSKAGIELTAAQTETLAKMKKDFKHETLGIIKTTDPLTKTDPDQYELVTDLVKPEPVQVVEEVLVLKEAELVTDQNVLLSVLAPVIAAEQAKKEVKPEDAERLAKIDALFDDLDDKPKLTMSVTHESETVEISEGVTLLSPEIDLKAGESVLIGGDNGLEKLAKVVVEKESEQVVEVGESREEFERDRLGQTGADNALRYELEVAEALASVEDSPPAVASPIIAVFDKIVVEAKAEEALSDEDKALADAVEDDGEEVEEIEHEQFDLFGDISKPKITRRKMFDKETMIDTAFAYHREQGFPYREMSPAMAMVEIQKLAETEGDILINTNQAYQVADSFHRHRFHAAANGMSSPFDSFNDDKKLRKAIKLELNLAGKPRVFAGGMMTLVNGTQACSNFRPGFASYLYRKYCPENATVLDTSTGYGGRLIGAVASQMVSKYIGIDPNVPTFQANMKMIETLRLNTLMSFELINLPAEDVNADDYAESCDFSFTSPPYFAKEIYSQDETQSWKRYSTGESWRDGFLRKMLELTFIALKPGSTAIVNIADVKVKNKKYPLADWTREQGVEVGFTYIETDKFPMMTRFGKGMADEVAFEPVIIFKKEIK